MPPSRLERVFCSQEQSVTHCVTRASDSASVCCPESVLLLPTGNSGGIAGAAEQEGALRKGSHTALRIWEAS